MRDWNYHDHNYSKLLDDVYPQPADIGHTKWAGDVINKWLPLMPTCKSVLDVGCGEAFCQPIFENLNMGIHYTGICLGEDFLKAKEMGRNVYLMDFNFIERHFVDTFDMIFSRHSLEHSPMPLLTLMEWYNIAKQWLCLILPTPEFWSYVGKNHYSVLALEQAKFLLDRAGWNIMWEDHNEIELRFMCEKKHDTI